MIMQMAQKKEISPEMVAPILSRKAELMEAVARSKALQQPAMQPTVMEQVMAKNIQGENPAPQMPMPQAMPQQAPQQIPQMPEEAGVAQLPIPERQYAGGGIIAFADGGMSEEDEDYEDSLEEADYQAMIERAMNAGEGIPQFETKQAAGSPQSFPNSARSVGIATPREQKGDLEERLRSAILQKESGGKRYDKNGKLLTSNKGAEGEMQVMPYTSKDPGFGVKPARSNDPDELRRVGDEYASAMLRRYRDPKLAMIAYNMGPGATDKWLAAGADVRKLPKETQGYISGVNLAYGGEIRSFANEGYVDPMGGYGGDYEERDTAFDPFQKALADYKKQALIKAKTQKALSGTSLAAPSATPNVPARSNTPAPQDFRDFDQAAALFQAENMGKNIPIQTQEAPKSQLDLHIEDMKNRAAENKAQRSDDKNMALLTAGLGMLGGTSPYAMANIGQGALAGVQNLNESRKQRSAEQAAIDKSMLYATRYKGAEDVARQNALGTLGVRQNELFEKQRANNLGVIKSMKDDARAIAIAGLKAQGMIGMDMENPDTAMKIEEATRAILSREPAYADIYKSTFGVDYNSGMQNNFAGFSAKERPKK
jgi:soluble lytic murein transglycosylase-like protein